MTDLLSCVWCGNRVSSKAYECPKCGEQPQPRGFCLICGKLISRKETTSGQCHAACVSGFAASHPELREYKCGACGACGACGVSHPYEEHYAFNNITGCIGGPACDSCGHPTYIAECDCCRLPVECSNAVVIKPSHPDTDPEIYWHRPCMDTARRTRADTWRSQGRCECCGQGFSPPFLALTASQRNRCGKCREYGAKVGGWR